MKKLMFTNLTDESISEAKKILSINVPIPIELNGDNREIFFEYEKFMLFNYPKTEYNKDLRASIFNLGYSIQEHCYLAFNRNSDECFAKFIDDKFGRYIIVDEQHLDIIKNNETYLDAEILTIANKFDLKCEVDRKILLINEYSKRYR